MLQSKKSAPDRQLQILFSAGRVFAKKGYHDASISDIIKHAGIARGTFYLYFKHKRDVFDHLLNDLLQRLDTLIKPVELGPQRPEPLQQVKDNIRNVLQLVINEPELAQILLHQSTGLDKRSSEAVHTFYERVLRMIEQALQFGIKLNIVRKCNTKITAIIALGTVKEVANNLISENKIPPLEDIADEIIQYGMNGIFTLEKKL